MGRLFLILLSILLPLAIYAAYLAAARRKAKLKGEGKLPHWAEAPWTWIFIAMVLLFVALLFALNILGIDPDDFLSSPSLITAPSSP